MYRGFWALGCSGPDCDNRRSYRAGNRGSLLHWRTRDVEAVGAASSASRGSDLRNLELVAHGGVAELETPKPRMCSDSLVWQLVQAPYGGMSCVVPLAVNNPAAGSSRDIGDDLQPTDRWLVCIPLVAAKTQSPSPGPKRCIRRVSTRVPPTVNVFQKRVPTGNFQWIHVTGRRWSSTWGCRRSGP